jgi:hypothetical protein
VAPEVVAGRVGEAGSSARRGDDSPNAKDNFEFDRRARFLRKSGAR